MPNAKTTSRKSQRAETPETGLGPEWLTRVAFGLALAIVVVRATMLEVLRDPMAITPNSAPVARAPGAATSLMLDLLAWVPAMLVLARAAFDRTFRVHTTWAHILLGLLAGWAMLSPLWAADRFAAVVSAFHLLSAAVFLWSASQLVTSWRRIRIVGGVCAGLLLLHGAHALNYRYVERPQMQEFWKQDREKNLRDRGLDPDSFAAQQFEAKVLRGEMMGFHASPNSFAAVTVLLLVVTLGLVCQRLTDRDPVEWAAVPLVGVLLGACIVVWSDSKTAYLTPIIGGVILTIAALAGARLARRAKLVYAAGVAAVLLGIAAVIAHGVYHGSLVIDSLTFRWRYWVGAARVFMEHPLIGVGWENFGQYYLAKRLPIAAEEVRDPHNFLVRFATELGAVGAVLCAAWMLRLWWELTTPSAPLTASQSAAPRRALPSLITVVATALLLSILATVDFAFMSLDPKAGPALVVLRILERSAGAVLLLAGVIAGAVRSLPEPILDDRPAPWLQAAVVAALAVFLLHNLVDFAMFELGAMFLFALLAGGVIGMRCAAAPAPETAQVGGHRRMLPLAAAGVVWLVAACGLAVPVIIAEDRAAAGDEFVRTNSPAQAADAYHSASSVVPYNADYAYRAAGVGGTVDAIREGFARAIRINPMQAGYRFTAGAFEARLPQPDAARVKENYDAGLAIDPANVPMRLEYAEALERLGLGVDAKAQFEHALSYNDQLDRVEVERLSPARVEEIRGRIERLGG